MTTAEQAIKSVKAIGFVDTDGSKLKAIALEYDRPIEAKAVSKETFAVEDYGMTLSEKDLTQGSAPGAVEKVYVNDTPEVSAAGGTSSGRYVIIEVNTDYQAGRFPRSYAITMAAGVKQCKAVHTADGLILPSEQAVTNYTQKTYIGYDPQTGRARAPEYYHYANEGAYTIAGLEGYQLHTIEDSTAFHATHCFDEANVHKKRWSSDQRFLGRGIKSGVAEQQDARLVRLQGTRLVAGVVGDEFLAILPVEQVAGDFFARPVAGNQQRLAAEVTREGVDIRVIF